MKLSRITLLYSCLHLLHLATELNEAWLYEKSKRWRNRQWLCHPIHQRCLTHGFFATQFQEIKHNPDLFFKYLRKHIGTFNHLLLKVQPYLIPRTRRLNNISTEERLVITLRYLASGDDILSMALLHRIGKSTAYKVIKDTGCAIHQALSPIYLRPTCTSVWRNISKGFEQDWQLSGCIGAFDGKHIAIKCPPNSKHHHIFLRIRANVISLLSFMKHTFFYTSHVTQL